MVVQTRLPSPSDDPPQNLWSNPVMFVSSSGLLFSPPSRECCSPLGGSLDIRALLWSALLDFYQSTWSRSCFEALGCSSCLSCTVKYCFFQAPSLSSCLPSQSCDAFQVTAVPFRGVEPVALAVLFPATLQRSGAPVELRRPDRRRRLYAQAPPNDRSLARRVASTCRDSFQLD